MVIFGATGDLSARKLLPAIYNLTKQRLLPAGFAVVGAAIDDLDDAGFRKHASDVVTKFSRTQPIDAQVLQAFLQSLFYLHVDFSKVEDFRSLERKVEELDWWQRAGTAPLQVTLTPAQHFSARGPFDRNRALWGGFLIEARGRRILFAGDSGYGPHFREIGARLSPIDLALLPIGAYEPRWFMKDIHMNPAEAVQAHLDLGARRSIGMHFGTFQLTPEGIDEPVRELGKALQQRGVPAEQFRPADVGESVRLSG
jgi:hypothetical protein